jgi:hypothetical protein
MNFEWSQLSPMGKWPKGQNRANESPNQSLGFEERVDT